MRSTPLISRAPLNRHARLRPVSAKRRRQQSARRAAVAFVITRANGRCELRTPVCTGRATTMHELRKRSQCGSHTDPENGLASCWACNDFVENEPNAAHALGLVIRHGETAEDAAQKRRAM